MYVYKIQMFCVILLIFFDSQVVSLTGEKIGKISKQWSGLAREIFTDADFFGINFPLDLDVRMKAVLLGATFLIVSVFFSAKIYCSYLSLASANQLYSVHFYRFKLLRRLQRRLRWC